MEREPFLALAYAVVRKYYQDSTEDICHCNSSGLKRFVRALLKRSYVDQAAGNALLIAKP